MNEGQPMGTWGAGLLESLAEALGPGDVLLVLGASWVAKVALVTDLGALLVARGQKVCLLGADPGQPPWGPPGCVALSDPEPDGGVRRLAFTGSLDPVRHVWGYQAGLLRIRSAAPSGAILLVDGPGVTRGWVAVRFVETLIGVLRPKVVVLFTDRQVEMALGPWLEQREEVKLVRLDALSQGLDQKKRPPVGARSAALDRYLADADELVLDRGKVLWMGPVPADGGWEGCLVGLLDAQGETLALGEVTRAEPADETALPGQATETEERASGVEGGRTEQIAQLAPLALPVSLGIRTPLRQVSSVRTVVFGTMRRAPDGAIHTARTPLRQRRSKGSSWTMRPRPRLAVPLRWPEAGGRAPFEPRMLNSLFGDPALLLRQRATGRGILFDLGWLEPLPARVLHTVTDLFVTHAHMDHLQGLVTLLRLMMGTGGEVRIYGPPGIDQHVAGLLQAFRFNLLGTNGPRFLVHALHGDRIERVRLTCADPPTCEHRGTERRGDGALLCEPEVSVWGWPLEHNTPVLGFRFEAFSPEVSRPDGVLVPGRTFRLVYVADAADTPANRERIIEQAAGADLLVCESMFVQAHLARATRTGHLTARTAAEIALEAGVKRLVPFHFSPRYEDDPAVVYQEILPIFDRVEPAVELS
ncbi:MAG: hypothetical protein JW797_02485 [Bradymonadales bacterium]|nr:hypothetical protein [Bradymonadales bacterium]